MSTIRLEGITVKFGSLIANNNISIEFKPGEIHTLLGENGAGKSTLISVIQGIIKPNKGSIFINDKKITLSPKKAKKHQIYVVPQHFNMIENVSIIDNVIASSLDDSKYFLNRKIVTKQITKIIKKYNINIDLKEMVSNLTIGQKQIVEIIRMLYRNSNIIILDEPTAILNKKEIENLFKFLKQMRKENKTIIFISHKLEEVLNLSDKITVLHKGKMNASFKISDCTKEKLVKAISGNSKATILHKSKQKQKGKLVLSLKKVNVKGQNQRRTLKDVSLKVFENEIVGIAAIDGNGENELIESIVGERKIKSGSISLLNNQISDLSIKQRYEIGMSYVPSDTQRHAVAPGLPIFSNLILNTTNNQEYYWKGIWFKYKKGKEDAKKILKLFDIRGAESVSKLARQLSGGNLQKVVVGRELFQKSKFTVLAEPTKGLDVNAINNIYNKVIEHKENGNAILLYSSEIKELVNVCDRVYVMVEGIIKGEISSNITENKIMEMLI